MAVRIGIVADKGGVGRSELVRLLAERFAKLGLLTLCVDMDFQAIMSRRFGLDMYGTTSGLKNTAHLMTRGVRKGEAAEAIVPCRWETPWAHRISVIPSSRDLTDVDTNPGQGNPAGRLDRAMWGVDDNIHVTLCDTRPDMNTCTQSVWATCDYIFGITSADRDPAEGMIRTIVNALGLAEDLDNPDLKVGGVILNEYDGRSKEQQTNRELLEKGLTQVAKNFDIDEIPILPHSIPERTYIRYSGSKGIPLETYLEGDSMKNESQREEVDSFMGPIAQSILEVTGVIDA